MIRKSKNKKRMFSTTFKQLSPFLLPYRCSIIISSLLGLLASIATLAVPLAIKQISILIIAAIRSGGIWDFEAILMWGFIALGLLITAFICEIIHSYVIYGVNAKFGYAIRKRIVKKINVLPISYFDQRDIGEILSYLTNDTDMLTMSLNGILCNILPSFVKLLGSIIILFIFSYVLGLVVLLSLPLALLLVFIFSKKTIKNFTKRQKLISEITSISEENYDAQIIINAFNATERYQKRFDNVNESLRKKSIIAELLGELYSPILQFFGNIIFAIICLVAGYLIGSLGGSADDVATIVAAISYGAQLIPSSLMFAMIFNNAGRAIAASQNIFEFVNAKNQPDESHKTVRLNNVKGNIEFKNVKFGYDKKKTISNFNYKIKQGQKVAIVGHTGAGKTTLINLLMRFYETDNGCITIEGVDIKKMKREYVRSLFAMVLQDPWMFEGTFMENIKFNNAKISNKTVYKVCRATHCDEFIRQMGGYNKKINSLSGLSSGQMQLLNIARAMAQNAPLLILDEATSNVDVRTERLIQESLDKLMIGKTSFVIAHRLSTIKNADVILVMNNGKIVEAGKHDELLLKKGTYADIYYAQFSCNYKSLKKEPA